MGYTEDVHRIATRSPTSRGSRQADSRRSAMLGEELPDSNPRSARLSGLDINLATSRKPLTMRIPSPPYRYATDQAEGAQLSPTIHHHDGIVRRVRLQSETV
jgi:hypothetical protein